ncbi:MAG: IS5 family transposase [Alphaproteobacteria bacterium]
MAHWTVGQDRLTFAGPKPVGSDLDRLAQAIDWAAIKTTLSCIYAAPKGEKAWPPLVLFKALLIGIWHDLSDERLAGAIDDRKSFRHFCGFATHEPTPERTAFVRFRRALVEHGLDAKLLVAVDEAIAAQGLVVKTGTLVDATLIPSASKKDEEARWAGHRSKKPTHGDKAHVAADKDTSLIDQIEVTTANIHDSRMIDAFLPDDPGEVYADTAYDSFKILELIKSRGGQPRIVQRGGCGPIEKPELWNARGRKIRCRIEKIFGTWKRLYGLGRTRYPGRARVRLHVHLTAIAQSFSGSGGTT